MTPLRFTVCALSLIIGLYANASTVVTVDGSSVLTINNTVSIDQVIVNSNATLSGNGTLTGSLMLAGTLNPGASEVGTFNIQSNLTCNSGTIHMDAIGSNLVDYLLISGTTTGAASVLLMGAPAFSPQDLIVVQSGASSDFSGFSTDPISPNWLVRQEGNNLLIHELAYDADGDGRSDYFETVAGTDLNDTNSVFQYTAYGFTTNPANIQIGFNTEPGRTYSLEYTTNLIAGTWVVYPASTSVVGDGTDKQFDSPLNDDNEAFYRVGISRP